MAITIAPILQTIGSYDATTAKTIKFTIDGMNIIPSTVTVTIKENSNNTTVYTNTTTINLSTLSHTIPANSLQNNKYYKCYITITSSSNEISPVSNAVTFYCIPTPTFEFTNIPAIISTSSMTAILNYEQSGSIYDPLSSFVITLYNSQNNIVFTSSIIYAQSSSDLQVKIENIEEDSYILKAVGETANGLSIETQANFNVTYNAPNSYSSMYLDNLFDKGQIKLTSNIIGLIGTLVGEEKYIENSMIDLSDEGTYLYFDKGYLIQNNFYLKLWVKKIVTNTKKPFIEIKNSKTAIELYWREAVFKANSNMNKAFIELKVKGSGIVYTIHSNYIDVPAATEEYIVGIKKKDSLYKVYTELGSLPTT